MTTVSIEDFKRHSNKYEQSLREHTKLTKGVYYTDLQLVSSILDYLNIKNTKAIILDPCCGTGSFTFSLINRGFTNVYGADIDGKAIDICRLLTRSNHAYNLDTINEEAKLTLSKMSSTKFDYIIGNPPYCAVKSLLSKSNRQFQHIVRQSGNNMFVAALYRAFELAKDNGIISYIVPKTFLHVDSYKNLRKLILTDKTIISIVDLGICFKSVRGEQILITLRNSHTDNNIINLYNYSKSGFSLSYQISQDFFNDEIILFKDEVDQSIYKKLSQIPNKFFNVFKKRINRGKYRDVTSTSGRQIRKFGFKTKQIPDKIDRIFVQNIYSSESGIIASVANESLHATQTVTEIVPKDSRICRYVVGLLHSRLINYYLTTYCFNTSRLTMHTDAKYLYLLPFIVSRENDIINLVKALEVEDYMSDNWFIILEKLNDMVYNTYGMTDTERNYIDEHIKSVQSNKWYPNIITK